VTQGTVNRILAVRRKSRYKFRIFWKLFYLLFRRSLWGLMGRV